MSLYNMLFGANKLSPVLLNVINLSAGEIPRFRDCFIDGDYIVVHTRAGGGNRDWLSEEIESMCKNENYSHDEDDDFDSTYANYYFNIPDEYKEDIKALVNKDETYKPSEKWVKLFENLEKKDETLQG